MDPGETTANYDYTAVAMTNVDTFAIRKQDFNKVLLLYPAIANKFNRSANAVSENLSYLLANYKLTNLTKYL